MTGSSSRRGAILLALLMLFGGPLQTMLTDGTSLSSNPVFLEGDDTILFASVGDSASQLHLDGGGLYSDEFTLEVPSTQPVRDLHLSITPAITPSSTGLNWNDASSWTHPDASNEGTELSADGYLTGSVAGTLWDFNSNSVGWTFSNAFSSRVTSPSCGLNGSSGGSIRTYAGATYATSPVNDFSGVSTMPLHVWVREGSSSCGEEPDGNEDLQIQYRTASNTWTTLHTFSGSPSSTNIATQYMTNLPAAALHATTQIRFHQTSGSGTCCDYWFVDDVHFATPPSSEWTSPTIGWSSSSSFQVPQSTYVPMMIDAFVPSGAMLTWSVQQSNGTPIPGFTGTNSYRIPLNLLDETIYDSVRIHLSLETGINGNSPLVYSLTGDGAVSTRFSEIQTLQQYTPMCLNNDDFLPYGPVTSISLTDGGWAYSSSSSAATTSSHGTGLVTQTTATPYLLDQVDRISAFNGVGLFYLSSNGVSTSGGTGSGLTVDTVATPILTGLVDTVNLVQSGSGYVSQNVSVTGGSGSGLQMQLNASPITNVGLVSQYTSLTGGSGYVSATGVSTSGGNGTGLTVDVTASAILSGIVSTVVGLSGGTNYSVTSFASTLSNGTGSGLYVSINNVTNGSVGSISLVLGGSNYAVNDKIFIDRGDKDSYFYVAGITESGGAITSITFNNPGKNYLLGNTVNIAGGGGNANFAVSTIVREGGSITGVNILNAGSGYATNDVLSITGGDSNGRYSVGTVYDIGGNMTSVAINGRGTGYSVGDLITIGGGMGVTFTVNAVRHWGGIITSAAPQNSGQYYAIGDEATILGGAGNSTLEVLAIDYAGYRGGANCTLTTNNQHLVAPTSKVTGSISGTNIQLQIRDSLNDSWTSIATSSSFNYSTSTPIYDLQFRILASNPNLTYWTIDSFDYLVHYGQTASNPRIDFYKDQEFEWGANIPDIGTWGWQDRFDNGTLSTTIQSGMSGYASTTILVPQTDLHSFGFGAIASNGNITGYALLYQSQVIVSKTFESASLHNVVINASDRTLIEQSISSQSGLNYLSTRFVEMELEIYGTGPIVLGGLLLTYTALSSIQFQSDSSFILNLNDVRRWLPNIGGTHQVPIPFASSHKGGISVEILGFNASSSVTLIDSEWSPESSILTPSQRWRTVSMVHSIDDVSPSAVRLDIVDSTNHATWILPLSGGTPYGTGDSHLVEIHSVDGIAYNQSGTTVMTEVTFRILPSWNDAETIRVSTRLQLMNSVLSMPSTFTWGGMGSQGFENDLEIKQVTFTNSYGIELEPTDYYLKAGTTIQIGIQIGFEGMNTIDAFADGDAIVEFYRGEILVANTTTLDGNMWNITDNIPFTFGLAVWHFEVKPINGSGTTSASVFSRTFHIDSITPQVLETNMERYDHRIPSTTQTIQIQISDQPILPQNIHAMVWREWIDDDNLDNWPNENEYHPLSLYIPNNLSSLIGQYTLMMDDTGGSIGQKVSVYLTGSDDAGHPLENGGSNSSDEQLFMYQLATDGAPSVAANAFSFEGGKKPWLHPGTSYAFEVDISEPNGGSDFSTVVMELASNQGSDPLPILWDFTTGNCTTTSPHVLIEECEMRGANGPADPYERDMTLHVEVELAWTTPDLGETRREPGIRVIDRGGQEVFQAFPEHRWRFSAAMEIPEDSVALILSQGTLLDDGARLAPNSPLEVSGSVVFAETGLAPQFDCQIEVLFAGTTTSTSSLEGIWSLALQAPSSTMTIPMTWSVGCLQGQGIDATDQETSVRWIIVDGTGPEPVEVSNPRPASVLEPESHEFRILLSEAGGLDVDSLELVWWVEEKTTGDRLRNGIEPLTLIGSDISGLRLEVVGSMDLSEITAEMLENRLSVHVLVTGRDLADNEVLGLGGTPAGTPVGVWDMVWLKPEYSLQSSSITYSRLLVEIGQTSIVTAYVENTGTLNGSVEVVFTEVLVDGTRSMLRRMTVEVPKGGGIPVSTDWNPSDSGLQWVEVQLESGSTSIGPSIDVRPQREESFSEKVFGGVNPILGTFAAVLFLSIVLTSLVWARRVTLNRGSKLEYDWDGHSSEFEDEMDEYGDEADAEEEPDASASLGLASAAVETTAVSVEDTDWVMGSDGYWWYHDKVTDEWWYKNTEGEIVQHN